MASIPATKATSARSALSLVARACPLCGSTDESRVFAKAHFDAAQLDGFAFASRKLPEYMHYRLLSCPDCDLLYANPLPKSDALAEAYEEAAFDSGEEARWAARIYAQLLAKVHLPDRTGALDIGTGDGVFLEELIDRGFADVAGVEPSTAPVNAAKDAIRKLIRHDIFRQEDWDTGRFSLVTCFQTIEHLPDPLQTCRDAHRLLKPGGALMLVCHNRRAVSAKVLRFRSPIFDIEHLQLFSPRSARRLLQAAGYSDIKVVPVVNRYPLHYLLKLFPLPNALKLRLLPAARASRLGRTVVPVALGNLAVIGYKRGGQ